MVSKFLNELKIDTTDEEFREILKMTEDDIKFNKIGFNKKTTQIELINILNISKNLIKKKMA